MARRSKKTRVASLHDESYQRLVELLVQRRRATGKSQQAIADELGWNQSIIAKIETAQRRMDVVELLRIADAVGFDAIKFMQEVRRTMVSAGELSG